jgi:hypothetical protein
MAGILLDTNHISEALRPISRVRDRVGQVYRLGIRVGTRIPVLCELQAALPSGPRGEKFQKLCTDCWRVSAYDLSTKTFRGTTVRYFRTCESAAACCLKWI